MHNETHIDLECKNITKRFGSFTAVDDISFAIKIGSFFSILGPSGCGKTTLLRMLAGFENPTSGDINIKGKSMIGVAPNKRPVNMVFQHLALFPNMNVAENIAYGLRMQGTDKAEIKRKTDEVLARVNLPDSGFKQINQLSGGQKQRIAIARCLVLNPDVLLLDEPLGALDLKLREHMKVELKQLQKEFDTTFVYITHDQSEALVMSDQVAVMDRGRFSQVGDPKELYFNPQNAFVAGFIGDSNRWIGNITEISSHALTVKTQTGLTFACQNSNDSKLTINEEIEIFVRPEAIEISQSTSSKAAQNQLDVTVTNILFDGANSQLLVKEKNSGGELTVKLPQTAEFMHLKAGANLQISFPAEQVRSYSTAKVGA